MFYNSITLLWPFFQILISVWIGMESSVLYTFMFYTLNTFSNSLDTKEFPRTNKNVLFSAQKSLCQLWRRRNFKTIQEKSHFSLLNSEPEGGKLKSCKIVVTWWPCREWEWGLQGKKTKLKHPTTTTTTTTTTSLETTTMTRQNNALRRNAVSGNVWRKVA